MLWTCVSSFHKSVAFPRKPWGELNFLASVLWYTYKVFQTTSPFLHSLGDFIILSHSWSTSALLYLAISCNCISSKCYWSSHKFLLCLWHLGISLSLVHLHLTMHLLFSLQSFIQYFQVFMRKVGSLYWRRVSFCQDKNYTWFQVIPFFSLP